MPVIKSAIKKLRKDKKREAHNDAFRDLMGQAIKAVKRETNTANLSHAFSLIDKAAKKHLLHKNKAARMKSSLSKLITTIAVAKPTTKKTPSKASKTN
jgi:small subunit ribosomal protein S20